MTKDGFFKKYEYVYDEYNDFYICPNNKILKYSPTNRKGYKEYKSNSCECEKCPRINKCTSSKNHKKLVTRHIGESYVEEANHLRHDRYVNSIYKCRKETIERVFADAKEKHSMRYTHLRGLAKMKMEVTLTFACMNFKKMANHLWKRSGGYRVNSTFNLLVRKILIIILKSTKSIFLARRKCFLSTI